MASATGRRAPEPLRARAARAWANRGLLAEATIAVVAASIAIRLVPFRRLASWMGASAAAVGGDAKADEVARVRWAVDAVANRAPWRTVCFQRGLAAHAVLRRRGVPSTLHYGVRQTADAGLKAHVWVTAGVHPVMGVEDAAGFQRLASFPPAT